MADFDLDSIDDIDMNYDFGFTTVDEDEVQEQTAVTNSLVNRLAAATDATTHTPSVVQQVIVPVPLPRETVHHSDVQSPSMFQEPLSQQREEQSLATSIPLQPMSW